MLRVTLEIANLLFIMKRRASLGRGLFQKPLQQTRKSNKASSGNWTNAIEAERLAMCSSSPGPICPSRDLNDKAFIEWRLLVRFSTFFLIFRVSLKIFTWIPK